MLLDVSLPSCPAGPHANHRDMTAGRVLIGSLPQARDVFADVGARLRAAGQTFRPAPPEPDNCCGRGCNGCVWEGFYAAANYWQDDALDLLEARDRRCGHPPGPAP
jgi:hypothetical protein